MRINVYSQELTREVALVSKTSANGAVHYGVRIFFDGPPVLHNEPGDDDKSAITYWLPRDGSFAAADLADVFDRAAELVSQVPSGQHGASGHAAGVDFTVTDTPLPEAGREQS